MNHAGAGKVVVALYPEPALPVPGPVRDQLCSGKFLSRVSAFTGFGTSSIPRLRELAPRSEVGSRNLVQGIELLLNPVHLGVVLLEVQ